MLQQTSKTLLRAAVLLKSKTLNLPPSIFSDVSVSHCASLCSCTAAGLPGRTLPPGWSTPTRGQPRPLRLTGPRCCSSARRMWASMATLPPEKDWGKSRRRATATQTHWWAKYTWSIWNKQICFLFQHLVKVNTQETVIRNENVRVCSWLWKQ